MRTFKQVMLSPENLKSGLVGPGPGIAIPDLEVAVVGLEPTDLQKKLDISFQSSVDDLDYVDIALLEVDGARLALIRHQRAPSPGTELYLNRAQASSRALDQILEVIGLKSSDLTWRRPME